MKIDRNNGNHNSNRYLDIMRQEQEDYIDERYPGRPSKCDIAAFVWLNIAINMEKANPALLLCSFHSPNCGVFVLY